MRIYNECYVDTRAKALMILATGNGLIKEDKLYANVDGEMIVINDYQSVADEQEVFDVIYYDHGTEFILTQFDNFWRDCKSTDVIYIYKKYLNKGKAGSDYGDEIFFKWYKLVPDEEVEAARFGRKYIDYQKQIDNSGFISADGCGIWTTTKDALNKMKVFSDRVKRYGNMIMILEPVESEIYFESEISNEVIGHKFKVLFHGEDSKIFDKIIEMDKKNYKKEKIIHSLKNL